MKRILATVLALILALSLCVPAAAYSDDYWQGYDEGWTEGHDAGMSDAAAGVDKTNTGTAEQGRQDGYRDGYDAGYEEGLGSGDGGESETDEITSRGGVKDAVNVMFEGKCVSFSDARPANVKGRVMVPARAILEALKAAVTYDAASKTMKAVLGSRTVTHVVGTDKVTVVNAGETSTVTMDCRSYVSRGRTMVPARFLSEALGYGVEWDQDYQTVVILDEAGFASYVDGKTGVLNLLLADAAAETAGKTLRRTANLGLDVTLFDTISGDKRLGATASAETVTGEKAVNCTIRADLAQIAEYLDAQKLFGDDANVAAMLKKNLSAVSADVICNRETEELYVRSPLLDDYVAAGSWLESSLKSALGTAVPAAGEIGSVGKLLLFAEKASGTSPFYYHDELYATAGSLIAALGDDRFTGSGNTYTLTMDDAALNKLLGSGDSAGQLGDVTVLAGSGDGSFSLTFRVTKTGEKTCDYSLTADFRSSAAVLGASFVKTGLSETMRVDVHVKNTFKASLTGTAVTSAYTGAIQTEPPADAVTMDLSKLSF